MSTDASTSEPQEPISVPELQSETPCLSASTVRGLGDRSYERRKAAALEIEQRIGELNEAQDTSQIKKIIKVLRAEFIESTQANQRKGGLIGLAAAAIGLMKETVEYLPLILPPVLTLLHDQDSRVRYYSCESLYNITKVARGRVLDYFNQIYDGLCTLHADPDPDVRNGAKLLDRLLKDAVTESDIFAIDKFMPLLQERINLADPNIRELNVGWIQVLDSVPDIDMLFYLPQFLTGLFAMLADKSHGIVEQADQVLKEFLREISETKSMKFEKLVPLVIKEFKAKSNPLAIITALTWITEFLQFDTPQMVPFFPSLIDALVPHLSHENEQIQKLSSSLNSRLQSLVEQSTQPIAAVDILRPLTDHLQENQDVSTRLAVLDWIIMLLTKTPDSLQSGFNRLLPALLKILNDNADQVVELDLKVLSQISSKSKELQDVVFSNLVNLFCEDQKLLESRGALIVRRLCSLLGSEEVYTALASLLQQDQRIDSVAVLVETLNLLLLTASELYDLREKIKVSLSTKEGRTLFTLLFRSWCHNPAATLSLCLLAQCYELGSALVLQWHDLDVTVSLLMQLDRLVQLIESPIFVHLRLQLLEPQNYPYLLKILYGLLMILPQSAAFRSLSTRLQSVSTLGLLSFVPESSLPRAQPRIADKDKKQLKAAELLEHFNAMQEKHLLLRRETIRQKSS